MYTASDLQQSRKYNDPTVQVQLGQMHEKRLEVEKNHSVYAVSA